MSSSPSAVAPMYSPEDIIEWCGVSDTTTDDDTRTVVSKKLGRVLIKQRRVEWSDDEEDEDEKEEEMEQEKSDPIIRTTCLLDQASAVSAASNTPPPAPTFTSNIGSLTHEFEVLSHLHSHRISCIPSFAILLAHSPYMTLVQQHISGVPISAENISASSCKNWLQPLRQIHSAGIAHSDIKPEHVLVRDDDSVTLIDFDLSHSFSLISSTLELNHSAVFIGTPDYAGHSIHLGCRPTPVNDCESMIWIMLEICVKKRCGENEWKLPWRREHHEKVEKKMKEFQSSLGDAVPSNEVDQFFGNLMSWMEEQVWSLTSIHRAGYQKLTAIMGTYTQEATSVSVADQYLLQLLTLIRPHFLQLLQLTPREIAECHRLLAVMMELLLQQVSSSSTPASTDSSASTATTSSSAADSSSFATGSPSAPAAAASSSSHIRINIYILLNSSLAGDLDPSAILAQNSHLCRRVTQFEKQLQAKYARASPHILLQHQSHPIILHFPLTSAASTIGPFFTSLLSSSFIFTLPFVYLAMQLQMLEVVCDQEEDEDEGEEDDEMGGVEDNEDDAGSILQEMMKRK